ncbi:hypothetical protein D6779_01890 [Candidatus Parcubacteria bacterium]|nr:MAG: hypothetical protein D6779_01890 [Candidatus Parcubacteria bacterium]
MAHSPASLSQKVIVIGLDGATFDLIHPWVHAGHLPNIARLMQDGYHAPLRSTLQPVTSAAWASFMTGVNQGKHGLYDFIQRQDDSYDIKVTTGNQIKFPTIFEIASAAQKRVISINMPYTYPARKVNGVMASGPFAPQLSEDAVYPQSLLSEIKSLIPDYFIFPEFDAQHSEPLADYLQKLLREIEQREQLCLHYLETREWDLFSVVFMATDEVQHAYWHLMEAQHPQYGNAILQIYQRVDEAIGQIIATLEKIPGEKTIFVVSDHGGGALRWVLNLNRWLADEGLLAFQSGSKGIITRVRGKTLQTLSAIYKQFIPPTLRARIRAQLGNRKFTQIKGSLETQLLAAPIDWQHTQVYALGAGGNLFINLKGREPQGIVPEGTDYESLREQVIKRLYTLKDPETGQAIIKRVYRREEIYNGKYLPNAPDLIIEWMDYTTWGRGRYDSHAPLFEAQNHLEFSTIPLTGTHRPYGILIMYGDTVVSDSNSLARPPHIIDIAPTILGLLNIPIPDTIDGQALTPVLCHQIQQQFTRLTSAPEKRKHNSFSYNRDDEEKILERLRSLGYL